MTDVIAQIRGAIERLRGAGESNPNDAPDRARSQALALLHAALDLLESAQSNPDEATDGSAPKEAACTSGKAR